MGTLLRNPMRAGLKYRVLGKEGKQQRRSEQVKRESARAQRDNRRWKRVLAKMSAERKVAYQGVGNLGKKGRTRGVTRRSQAERKGKREDDDGDGVHDPPGQAHQGPHVREARPDGGQ